MIPVVRMVEVAHRTMCASVRLDTVEVRAMLLSVINHASMATAHPRKRVHAKLDGVGVDVIKVEER